MAEEELPEAFATIGIGISQEGLSGLCELAGLMGRPATPEGAMIVVGEMIQRGLDTMLPALRKAARTSQQN